MRFPKLNQVILLIILAEFTMVMASAITAPVFALFVTKDIGGGAQVVGFCLAIYATIKSLLQLPIARYLDRNHGEIDDYYSMIIGQFIAILVMFSFYFTAEVWHLYFLYALLAVADAFVVPPFYAIFTRHIDKGSEGFEWALRSSFSFGAGSALGGAFSGILVMLVGFRTLFLINGSLMFLGCVILLFLKPWIIPRGHISAERIFIERPHH